MKPCSREQGFLFSWREAQTWWHRLPSLSGVGARGGNGRSLARSSGMLIGAPSARFNEAKVERAAGARSGDLQVAGGSWSAEKMNTSLKLRQAGVASTILSVLNVASAGHVPPGDLEIAAPCVCRALDHPSPILDLEHRLGSLCHNARAFGVCFWMQPGRLPHCQAASLSGRFSFAASLSAASL